MNRQKYKKLFQELKRQHKQNEHAIKHNKSIQQKLEKQFMKTMTRHESKRKFIDGKVQQIHRNSIRDMYSNLYKRSTYRKMIQKDRYTLHQWFYATLNILNNGEIDVGIIDQHNIQKYNIEGCMYCNIQRVVNKERATASCPVCGSCIDFASHVFDIKDRMYKKVKTKSGKEQTTRLCIQKFMDQFEENNSILHIDQLDAIRHYLNRYSHTRSICKVGLATVKKCIQQNNMPSHLLNYDERIAMELRNDTIPEYTHEEIEKITSQRMLLKMAQHTKRLQSSLTNQNILVNETSTYTNIDDPISNDKSIKTQQNRGLTRSIGCSNGYTQSRLLLNMKTNSKHLEQIESLEQEYIYLKNNKMPTYQGSETQNNVNDWDMCPLT